MVAGRSPRKSALTIASEPLTTPANEKLTTVSGGTHHGAVTGRELTTLIGPSSPPLLTSRSHQPVPVTSRHGTAVGLVRVRVPFVIGPAVRCAMLCW